MRQARKATSTIKPTLVLHSRDKIKLFHETIVNFLTLIILTFNIALYSLKQPIIYTVIKHYYYFKVSYLKLN